MEYMRRRFHTELFPTTDPKGILPDINIPAEMQFMFKHPLKASALLKPGRNEEEAKQWLAVIFKAHSHLSAAMGVMHPQMYAIGWHTLIKIWEDASAEI
ncbi:hypothetical protein PAXRUDRAFT_20451 [Paxillus rubicundulus Ve08.2h10]|uniref:Uncharacterized protein n=1 Tax=Paxillus rubicundulus Ve08.2h10 TaxID=930991 RepID=A0A0D0D9J7_9AGAM|nr:hypothetical protein PAXRUDRAFT_20451 [Paxillus rubicundulus Ve08.2h10]